MANALSYSINNKEISFSTKSLTINGEEYLYKDITAIKHSSAKCLYLFKVDGKWHELYYDEAHKKGVTTIFKKVADHLVAVKKAKAAKEVEAIEAAIEATPEPAAEEAAAAEEPPAVDDVPSLIEALVENQGIAEEPAEEETPAEEEIPAEEETPVEAAEEEAPAEEEASTEEEEPAEEAPVEEKDSTEEKTPEETPTEEEVPAEEETPVEEEAPAEEEAPVEELDKKAKKKKAIIIFAAIIALFIIAGIAYFFTIGLPSESSPADGQDTTHQYNDIDELIDEMQE